MKPGGIRRTAAHAAVLAKMYPESADAIRATAVDPRDVARGRAAHAHGDELEAWLAAQHARALARGMLARMRHVGPPTAPHVDGGHARFDRRGRMLLVAVGVGPADYQGQLPGGRSIAIEAKSREGRLVRDEDLPAHQRDDLDACAAGGGLAVLVARLDGEVHAIPWREVPWCSPRGGSPSIGAGDVAAWRVSPRCLLDPRDAGWSFYLAPLVAAANDDGRARR